MLTETEKIEKTKAFDEAKSLETETGVLQYIVHCFDGSWVVIDDLPLMGEWYTTDGSRHG